MPTEIPKVEKKQSQVDEAKVIKKEDTIKLGNLGTDRPIYCGYECAACPLKHDMVGVRVGQTKNADGKVTMLYCMDRTL